MKLIMIYGPPAAGKLTVATELARQTGFKLFDNHVSIDCVKSVFEFGTPLFNRLIELIRYETIAEAARGNVSLIHTFVYALGEDDDIFAKRIAACEDNGGDVDLVLLTCGNEVLKQRIGNESRVRIGKLTDPDSIERYNRRFDLFSPYPFRESLIVETDDIPPHESVRRIVKHYRLAG